MRKGTRIALWVAAGCIFAGGILMGAGSIAGGQKQLSRINENANGVTFQGMGLSVGGMDLGLNESNFYIGEKETPGQKVLNGDFTRSFQADSLRKLDITVGVHTLSIVESDVDEVIVEGKNCEKIQCYEKEGELVLKDVGKKETVSGAVERRIILTVPKGTEWEEADVNAAMAAVVIERLEAAEADLTAGMGSIEIADLTAAEANIEADMGTVMAENFSIRELDISADMGSVEMKGELSGSLEAEVNMGSVYLELAQSKEEFDYTIETSMGSVVLDGESYTKLDQEMIINNTAGRSMELDASMGSIEISFK